MALTIFKTEGRGGPGNLVDTSLFYVRDMQQVMKQDGTISVDMMNYKFRDKPVTVFMALNDNGDVLPLLALPCPPYYHEESQEASPGNILD